MASSSSSSSSSSSALTVAAKTTVMLPLSDGAAVGDDGDSTSAGEAGSEDESEEGSNVIKINDEGELAPALVDATPEGLEDLSSDELDQMGPPPSRPRVAAIGFSPTGQIYVLFEYPFIYRMAEPGELDGLDPWSPSAPTTCQLFEATVDLEGAVEGGEVSPNAASNLTCVTDRHEIPTWMPGRVMQFAFDGTLFFPAHISGTNKDIFYAYDPVTRELTEKVNANICWRDVEVTQTGSIFYTGTTKDNANDCSGSSFFRYISAGNTLIEIARGWWDFAYESEVDPENPDASERILFYGPDPDTSTGLPSWDTACLYRYDPSVADPSQRATRLATCLHDIWGWVDARDVEGYDQPRPALDVRLIKQERCEGAGQVFIGGAGIGQLQQGADGDVYLVGELQRKRGGEFHCGIEIRGPHCSSLDPSDDETSCAAGGDTWVNDGWCDAPQYYPDQSECEANAGVWNSHTSWYDNVTTNACLTRTDGGAVTDEQAAAGVVAQPTWKVQWVGCRAPTQGNGNWTETIQGLAHLDPDSSSGLLTLLSANDEQVIKVWTLAHDGQEHVYYSSFATGRYLLAQLTRDSEAATTVFERKVLLEEFEVYNLSPSPSDPNRLMFDALYFPTNSYNFGSIDVSAPTTEEVEASLAVTEGLTGRITTLMIVPDF